MDVIGLVENMGPFKCPCCGKTIQLFKKDGGRLTAETMGIGFLGSLPFDSRVVKSCDEGKPIVLQNHSDGFAKALDEVVDNIVRSL